MPYVQITKDAQFTRLLETAARQHKCLLLTLSMMGCPHCENLMPILRTAGKQRRDITFATIQLQPLNAKLTNTNAYLKQLASQAGKPIQGYPTILQLNPTQQTVYFYDNGPRTMEALINLGKSCRV